MASSTANSEDEFPTDKTYVQREGTENVGAEYEYLIPTLFAIRCIFREDIKNIWLGCNVEGLGAFDDVFLNVEYGNGKKSLYVIQLKHVKGPIKISSFTDVKDKNFNFDKYYKSFQKIQQICGNSEYILHNVEMKDINFFIYTTANLNTPSDKVVIPKLKFILEKVVKFEENQLFNTTATRKGDIYKFQPEEPNTLTTDTTFLSNFYLLLNQSNVAAVQQFIHEAIHAKFDHIDDNVKANFMHYIKTMTTGSKPYQLQKHDLQTKLIELVLTPYIVEPDVSTPMKNIDLWNEVVEEIDVVVFQNDTTAVVAKIWSTINEKVKKYLNKTMPDSSEWLKPIDKKTKEEFFKKYKNQYLESLLKKQLGPNGTITLKSLYIVLWKAELVPLFLRAGDLAQQTNIAKAIKLIKTLKNKKRFILIDKENFESKHNMKNLKIFRNVADLSKEKVAMLENVKVNFQGRKNDITLNKIISLNENIKTTISSELLLELIHETQTIGKKLEKTLDYYIERHVIKTAVHISALQKLKESIFVIFGTKKALYNLKPLEKFFDSDLPYNSDLKNTICNGTENVVVTTKTDIKIFQEICNLVQDKNIHKLRICEETQDYLEWLDSNGSIEELQPFLKHHGEFSVSDNDLLSHVAHRTNIISANSGMGKSVLINNLALNYSPNFWIIKFNISDHIQNINEKNFFDYFYSNNELKISAFQEFTKAVFSALVKLKKVCIFVDGCDEVLGMHLDEVSQLLTYLDREGFHLWITGRPIAKQHLESLFSILSLNLKPFTAADQMTFLQKYFLSKKENEENLHFLKKIQGVISNSFSSWKEDFAGVPLQIRMIAELFLNENSETFDKMDLISLYEHFIDNKLNIYWKKLYGDSPNAQLLARIKKDNRKLILQHMNVALTVFYDRELLETVLDYDDLEEFLQDIKTGTENVGIITGISEKFEPTFEHRSFAEYLTARWLAERCKKKKGSKFIFRLFERDSREVRQFFDRMLATKCPLHEAILNCDMQATERLLGDPGSIALVDEGGRTALHLVASWCTRHVFPTNPKGNDVNLNIQEHYIEEPLFSNSKQIMQKLLILTTETLLFQKDNLMGWSALDYADKIYCLDAIEEMSVHFHQINLENLNLFNHTNSLLYYCARYAYINIFKAITEHPRIFNEFNQTLVHTATQNGNRNILKCMLDEYRQTYVNFINVRDKYERTPLYYACMGPTMNKQPSDSKNHVDYVECVQMLIKANAEINVNDENGYIELHAAAEYGSLDILKMLIQSGSNIDHSSQNGSTPLHVAAYKGHSKCILELACNKADLNAHNIYGQTAISFASILGHIETLQELLKLKADFNKCDDKGGTPLLCTVIRQHVECAKALVSKGADVNSSDVHSLSPLYVAAKLGNKKIIQILLQAKADVNQGRKMSTPLHVAACVGHLDCVRLLIGNGAKVNAENSEGSTPLHECAREGHVNILQFLIKSRAIVNSITNTGNAPLHLAVEMGHFDTVLELIKNKADVNITTNSNATPLNLAAHNGHLNIMKLLIEAKAMINLPTASDTALHLACFSGHIQCIHTLVKKGAIVNVRNNLGITPLHIAAKEGHSETIDILIKADTGQRLKNFEGQTSSSIFIDQLTNFGASPLALAISDGHTDCVRKLILNGANINAKDNEGCTPLFNAVSNGYFNVVKLLIESGAAVNETMAVLSPLGAAVIGNRIDIIKLLVEHKANVNEKLNSELTLLHLAVYRGYFDIVKYLVLNGVNITEKNINGKTSLDLAIDMYSLDNEISYFLHQNLNKP